MAIGATVAELRARLSVDPSDKAKFKRDMADADRAMGRTATSGSRSFSKLGRAAKIGLIGGAAAGFYALGKAAKIGWDEYNQGAKVAAQTNAVIKSTGGAARVSAKQVESLGTALMMKSGVDDEVIKSGENVLLTFKNIRDETGKGNDIFDQATQATLDLSVSMGKDLNSSAVMVGKALNDPIRGMTALTRVGVTFSDKQRNLITRLVETGDTLGAQKVIMRELNTEFGGSAKAAGETLPGKLAILRERFNNFAGQMVEKVIPPLSNFVDFIDKVSTGKTIGIKLHTIFAGAGGALENLLFGSPSTRVKVPIEGGRFEWQIKGGGTGLVGALAKAIRDIDWVMVGREIAQGINKGATSFLKSVNFPEELELGPGGKTSKLSDQERFVKWIGLDPHHDYSGDVVSWFGDQAADIAEKTKDTPFFGPISEGVKNWGRVLGLLTDDAEAANTKVSGSLGKMAGRFVDTERSSHTFQQAFSEHMDIVAGDTDHSTDRVEALRAKVASLKSKTVKVTADVSGLSATAALAEHLALINRNKNINVTVNGPSGDGLIGVGGVSAASVSPTLFDDLGLAQAMGLVLSSGYRPGAITSTGNPSLHGVYPSKAIDVSGSEASMAAFFRSEVLRAPFTGIRELIHNPYAWYPGAGLVNIAGTALGRDHIDHVHVGSYDQGGFLRPGWNLAYNGLGRPEPVGAGNTYNFNGAVLDGDKLWRMIQEMERRNGARGGS